jgi:mannose-1-phosphate guanylyltransferase/phosphomannomutase
MTSLRPKPMVPVVNQPIMEHIIGLVKHYGIDEVVATLAFMPQFIEDYFGDGFEWSMRIDYAIEESPLGTAGSVKNAQSLLDSDEPFLVISGDAITDINLREVIDFHRAHGGAATIALKRVSDPLEFGVVVTGEDGRVERFLEKPTWGQVFSDTINTGIYVIEPWVLEHIPEGEKFDFSSDLFPKLMSEGHEIYGMVADGYWCDVGSRESYMQVHRDILDGKAMIFIPGVEAREHLWVAETAKIERNTSLGDHVVIGENVHIREGASIGDYTVIADNCVVGNDARVSHSVLWPDTFVGKQSSVAGAVLCRGVDVRARAAIDVGAVIGDESVIGHGAHVGVDVQVFPYKRVEPAATVTSSLIWESTGSRSLFGDGGITGLVGIDITAELALRVAEAFGTVLKPGGHVVVTRDTTRGARMVKRALVAGLNATGMNVRDLRVATPSVSRFTTQKSRSVGGIHVSGSPGDPQSLEMRFFDSNGLDIGPWEQKKVERLYFRGEFRRAFFDEIGDILYPPRPLEYYTEALREAVQMAGLEGEWRKVVADMGRGTGSIVLPQVAHSWRINLIGLNAMVDSEATMAAGEADSAALDELERAVGLFKADLGVVFDWGAERVRLMTPAGRLLDGDTALHAVVELWCRTHAETPGAIAVPLTASEVAETIAAAHGREVVRPGRSRRALAQAILDGEAAFGGSTNGGFIFGDFFPAFDGVLSTGMIVRMLARCECDLDALVETLPRFHKLEVSIFCPVERKGAVMRAVTEAAASRDTVLAEGVRVNYSDGWALVLPHSTEPSVSVWAEASSALDARSRADEWRAVVQNAISAL